MVFKKLVKRDSKGRIDYSYSDGFDGLYGACDALDLYDIDYDLDDGDRIMVDDSLYDAALDAFDEYDIEYEEV